MRIFAATNNNNNNPGTNDNDNHNAAAGDNNHANANNAAPVVNQPHISFQIGFIDNDLYPIGLRIDISAQENLWMEHCCLRSNIWFPAHRYIFTLAQVTAINQLIERIRHGNRAPGALLRPEHATHLVDFYARELVNIRASTLEAMHLDTQTAISISDYYRPNWAQASIHRDGPMANGHLFFYFALLEALLLKEENRSGLLILCDINTKMVLTGICLAFTVAVTGCSRRAVLGL